ncbi:hypothetical protein DPMN_174821 [Dreissena polymorpha]|uniref:Uncharacterized protein n=1 Tax=Dreissena polymorpha TaxID=45954 RepID=A0A9D4E7W0_DREPO|nr:hypothetical protein DPMN_174821 [Dreissena polymorpha]
MIVKIILLCVCTITEFSTSNGTTYEAINKLKADLLDDYNPDTAPVKNSSTIIRVNIALTLFAVPDLDPVLGLIQATFSPMCFWTDEIMTWDPANYNNIQKVHFKEEEIWHPSLLLATPNKFTVAGGFRQRIKIQANGNAEWAPGEVWESSCRFNMKFWPFDKQTCEIEFINLDFTAEEVQLHHLLFNQDNFVPNSEWTLEGLSATTLTRLNFSVIRYSFKLKRESTFYVLTLILPITFLGISSVMVFLLPAESGERVGFSITLMLTMTTFLAIVSDIIPKTATPPSLMAVFVFLLVMFSIKVLILSILNLMLYHRSDDIKIHKNYITIFKLSSFAFCCKTKKIVLGQVMKFVGMGLK